MDLSRRAVDGLNWRHKIQYFSFGVLRNFVLENFLGQIDLANPPIVAQ